MRLAAHSSVQCLVMACCRYLQCGFGGGKPLNDKRLRFETQAGCRVSLLCTRHPTISDVARLASVSTAMVSRTLNDPGQVKPDTRERVLLAISELGYSPNLQARDLALGRSSLSSRNRQESTSYGTPELDSHW
jgi:hypothetical protein